MGAEDKTETGNGGGGASIDKDAIRAAVREVLAEEKPAPKGEEKPAPKAAEAHDIESQVKRALAAVQAQQKADEKDQATEARLKALEERPAPEKKPREFRRITQKMWGDPDAE